MSAFDKCDQCESGIREYYCHACERWQCSAECCNDHNRREHPTA